MLRAGETSGFDGTVPIFIYTTTQDDFVKSNTLLCPTYYSLYTLQMVDLCILVISCQPASLLLHKACIFALKL